MSDRPPGLPDFGRPPVAEVALGLQFEPLTQLRAAHLGLLWERWRDEYPNIEEHQRVVTVVEDLEGRGQSAALEIQLVGAPEVPRVWFLSADRRELLQFQNDRLVCNWRKLDDADEYPRYEYVRGRFESALPALVDFLDAEQIGKLVTTQAELTYVNHIVVGEGWSGLGAPQEVLRLWAPAYDQDVLGQPEDVRMAQRHLIRDEAGKAIGRLYIIAEPAIVRATEVLQLTLIVRGRPSDGLSGAFEFLDMARERIVEGFAAVTTEPMHDVWGRTQ